MSQRDLLYVGHMLDMARKAVGKTQGIPRAQYDADENRLANRAIPGNEFKYQFLVLRSLPLASRYVR